MRTYTKGERQEAIDRFISGESAADIHADTGIPKSTFYNWLHIYQEEKKTLNKRTVNIRNFHLLENKVVRLENIIEILKSANCTSKSPLKQKLCAAEQFYGKYSVHVICDAFDIPRGTFYNQILRNKKTTHGMQSAKKSCGFKYRKFTTKAIKYSVLPKLLLL